MPLRAQIEACIETAQGCSAASWLMMVCGAHDFVLGSFGEKCLTEVWANGPDTLIAGTLAPQGKVRRADGGWINDRNGRWYESLDVLCTCYALLALDACK